MIQRIQTVWLLLIALLNGGLIFFPALGCLAGRPILEYLPVAEAGLAVFLSVVVVFLYKHRRWQVAGCYGVAFLQIALLVTFLLSTPLPVDVGRAAWVGNLPLCFPLIGFLLDVAAMRAIRRDERLVRSADRLR
jgi:hypothetical protein